MIGWIKLHRSLKDWEWYHDANALRLLVHLLVSVNYEPKKWKGIEIKAGQLITSYDNLGRDLKMTKQQIRTALKKCEDSKEITRERTRDCLHISLVKWDEMQNDQPELNTKNNPSLTREQPENNPSLTPTKEVKKEIIKKDKKEKSASAFDPLEIVSFYHNPKFNSIWLEWLKVRQSKKASQTDNAIKRALTKVNKLSHGDLVTAIKILETSCDSGWSDIYQLKNNSNGNTTKLDRTEQNKRDSDARTERLAKKLHEQMQSDTERGHNEAPNEIGGNYTHHFKPPSET